jgi:peptidoglycan/xylan/chitin deacetylase (PgdA/CDA1 family)
VQGLHPTVATVLQSAGLRAPGGLVYSVVSHRLVKDGDASVAPLLLLDGQPAVASTPVRPGARIVVRKGSAVEPTTLRSVTLVAGEAGTASPGLVAAGSPGAGLPDVERSLWHPGSLARQAQLVGKVSGEVVATSPVTPATPAQPEVGKVVALTFDDGPNPTWTPQVLQILRTKGVPATFCDVGRWAWAHPDLVRAEVAQGDTVCDHTVDHDVSLDRAPHERVAFEVGRGADMVEAASGVRPVFYRPPAGILSPDVIATAQARGLRVLTWSVDPTDYLMPPPDVLLARILSHVRPGAVILLHDGGGFRANTVAVLPPVIDALIAQGYRFTTPEQEAPVG